LLYSAYHLQFFDVKADCTGVNLYNNIWWLHKNAHPEQHTLTFFLFIASWQKNKQNYLETVYVVCCKAYSFYMCSFASSKSKARSWRGNIRWWFSSIHKVQLRTGRRVDKSCSRSNVDVWNDKKQGQMCVGYLTHIIGIFYVLLCLTMKGRMLFFYDLMVCLCVIDELMNIISFFDGNISNFYQRH